MTNQFIEEEILLQLTYYGKLRIGDDNKDSRGNVLTLIFFAILFFFTLWLSDKIPPKAYYLSGVIIILLLSIGIINMIFKAFYDKKNLLYLTSESITICNHKGKILKKWMLTNVHCFYNRKYETEDENVNQLVIVYEGKEEYIDLNMLDEKQISVLISKIETLNFEVAIVNR